MLDQEIRVYLNAQNYNYNNSSYKQLTRSVDITEIQAYSVLNGGFSGKPVSNSGKPFYESLIVLALMQQGNSLYATSDYLEAETSYCHCISFHLGMTAARLVFKKKFNLDLLHLKDPAIAVHTKSNSPLDQR